jgi:hypothetical protein
LNKFIRENQKFSQILKAQLLYVIQNSSEAGRQYVQKHTEIALTRDVYEGIKIDNGIYYKDNLSIKSFCFELNNIQVQSTVDWTSKYLESEAPQNNSVYDAKVGVSGKTNPLIKDTILFDANKANFFHGPKDDYGHPFSGGCTVSKTKADEREVLDILRNDLGYKNNESVKWNVTLPNTNAARGNLE